MSKYPSEKFLEDYFYSTPDAVRVSPYYDGKIDRWFGRQVEVPSGIIDLLGISGSNLAVVEIKNDAIKATALTQVMRYKSDIQYIVDNILDDVLKPNVYTVVIGLGMPSRRIILDASQMGITLITIIDGYIQEPHRLGNDKLIYSIMETLAEDIKKFVEVK